MNMQEFEANSQIVADFNIGGKRVNGAILDFSGIDSEQMILAGIGKVLIDVQNAAKLQAAKGLPERSKWSASDKASYEAALEKLAADWSESQIDMAEYCASRNWNFRKGESADAAEKLIRQAQEGKLSEAKRLALLEALQG